MLNRFTCTNLRTNVTDVWSFTYFWKRFLLRETLQKSKFIVFTSVDPCVNLELLFVHETFPATIDVS